MGGQKKFYNRWMSTVHNDLLYKRCKALTTLFNHCQKSFDLCTSTILTKKQYSFNNIQKINGFFSKVKITNTINLRTTIQ